MQRPEAGVYLVYLKSNKVSCKCSTGSKGLGSRGVWRNGQKGIGSGGEDDGVVHCSPLWDVGF